MPGEVVPAVPLAPNSCFLCLLSQFTQSPFSEGPYLRQSVFLEVQPLEFFFNLHLSEVSENWKEARAPQDSFLKLATKSKDGGSPGKQPGKNTHVSWALP